MSTLQGDSVAETFGNIVEVGQQPEVHQVTYLSQTVDQTQNFQPIPLLQTQYTGTFHTVEVKNKKKRWHMNQSPN